jgi:branched-chain amino acid transport system permease protein
MGQQILNAIFIGSIYALFAVGYTLVFGVLDILNLAHSAVFMLGAAVTYTLVVNHGQSFWVACAVGIVVAALMGLVIEYVCLRPLRRRQAPPIAALISTIGLALIIVALMLLLGYVMRFTQVGRGLRAVAENPRAARLMGIDVDRMISLTLIISSALGGLAGILFGVALGDISPYIGRDSVEVRGLAVIVLGGMGSIPGAVLGGYLLGFIEVLAVVLLGSNVRAGVAFAALFLMLVLRPQGLFGAQLREKI